MAGAGAGRGTVGCLARTIVAGTLVLQAAAFALTLAVVWSAGVLGEAAIISADDALVLFFLCAAGLAGTAVLAVALWRGGRTRRRQARELAALRAATTGSGGPGD